MSYSCVQHNAIAARFMATTAHLTATLLVFYTSDVSIQVMGLEQSDPGYTKADLQYGFFNQHC